MSKVCWKACKSNEKYVGFQTRQRRGNTDVKVFPEANIVTVLGEKEELL